MDQELQILDRAKWTPQEDDLLSKLFKHFAHDFVQISNQMNNIYFYDKMTPALCEYRWKFYIDGNINRSDFNGNEEYLMFNKMKNSDLYTSQFWFELSDLFGKRPPSVLKQCTMKFICKYLNHLNESYGVNKHARKKYGLRIKAFTIDIMMTFFRLGKERIKRSGPPTLLVQAIEQCNQLMCLIEQQMQSKGQPLRYDDLNDQLQQRFFTMIECLIFIDTIYKIYHKIHPYTQGEQAERDKLESLVHSKKLTAQSLSTEDKTFDDHAYEQLTKEDIRLIFNSDALTTFQQYFTTVE